MPTTPLLGTGGAGDSHVSEDVLLGHSHPPELALLGRGVHAGDALLETAAGPDVAVESVHSRNIPF